jgi:hypothetical protein
MYESLKSVCSVPFTLFIVALDEFTIDFFDNHKSDFPEVIAIPLSVLEDSDPVLLACKPNRSVISYYFTLSPCIPLYLLKKYNLPHICTLDADIVFYSDLLPIFTQLESCSIIITPHKFSKENQHKTKWGHFNVSFQIFKNDETGLQCLEKWREQCLDWCEDYFDEADNRFADQKYLDQWPSLYSSSLKVLDDPISGLAPWNLNNYKITYRQGRYFSNKGRIVYYHFHGLKIQSKCWVTSGFNSNKTRVNKAISQLYKEYIHRLLHNKAVYQLSDSLNIRDKNTSSIFSAILLDSYAYYTFKSGFIAMVRFWMVPVLVKKIIIKMFIIICRKT